MNFTIDHDQGGNLSEIAVLLLHKLHAAPWIDLHTRPRIYGEGRRSDGDAL